jgi:endonuclease YncB( thermonuclease family)
MNIRGRVLRVVDGDTVWLRVRVRLASRSAPGIATHEGSIAAEALRRELPPGSEVQVIGMKGIDRYGRIVGDLAPDRSGL